MQKTPRIHVDRFSEVFDLLQPVAAGDFYDFSQIDPEPGSVYIVGRQNLLNNMTLFCDMAKSGHFVMIFCNAAEGSATMQSQIQGLRLDDLLQNHHMQLIAAAPVDSPYSCLCLDHFLLRIMDFSENRVAQLSTPEIFSRVPKPHKFLFLNGRARPHRKYLYERWRRCGLLEHSLYTMLDAKPTVTRYFDFVEDHINVMATPTALRHLPDYYEVARYRDPVFGPITDRSNIKQELFRLEWGEIYLEPRAYIDTYFSVVTETVCAESNISFRTEKIAKPLAIGHPFIVAANAGFYRDLRSLGFRTFGHVIDETFDAIDHAQTRMDRITEVVTDLCAQDLDSFLAACKDVCKYNQQHLDELSASTRRDFPARFFEFLLHHG